MIYWTHKIIAGPWKDRIGHRCRTVQGPAAAFPWNSCLEDEVVIYIQDDPYGSKHDPKQRRGWTCLINLNDLEPIQSIPCVGAEDFCHGGYHSNPHKRCVLR